MITNRVCFSFVIFYDLPRCGLMCSGKPFHQLHGSGPSAFGQSDCHPTSSPNQRRCWGEQNPHSVDTTHPHHELGITSFKGFSMCIPENDRDGMVQWPVDPQSFPRLMTWKNTSQTCRTRWRGRVRLGGFSHLNGTPGCQWSGTNF